VSSYNSVTYNESSYNITADLLQNLADSLGITDADVIKDLLKPLQDSTTASDALTDGIFKLINDYILHADVETVLFLSDKLEVMNLLENMQVSFSRAPFLETITLTSSLSAQSTALMQDIIFLDETFTKQVTNKGLPEIIRLNDWLSVKLSPANQWSD